MVSDLFLTFGSHTGTRCLPAPLLAFCHRHSWGGTGQHAGDGGFGCLLIPTKVEKITPNMQIIVRVLLNNCLIHEQWKSQNQMLWCGSSSPLRNNSCLFGWVRKAPSQGKTRRISLLAFKLYIHRAPEPVLSNQTEEFPTESRFAGDCNFVG